MIENILDSKNLVSRIKEPTNAQVLGRKLFVDISTKCPEITTSKEVDDWSIYSFFCNQALGDLSTENIQVVNYKNVYTCFFKEEVTSLEVRKLTKLIIGKINEQRN